MSNERVPVSDYIIYASDFLCLIALHIASNNTLERFAATISLSPPKNEKPAVEEPKAPTPVTPPRRNRWYHVVFSLKFLKFIVFVICIVVAEFAIIFGMARFTNRIFLDVFWGGVSLWLVSFVPIQALGILFPSARNMSLEFSKDRKSYFTKATLHYPNNLWEKSRWYLGWVIGAAVMVTSYFGFQETHPLIAACWVLMMGTTSFPNATMKNMVKVVTAILVGIPAFTAVMVYFFPNNPDGKSSLLGENPSTNSPWLGPVMTLMARAWPITFPAPFISTTLHFDYRRSIASVALPNDQESVQVKPLKPFSRPTYLGGFLGAILGLVLLRMMPDVLKISLPGGNITIRLGAEDRHFFGMYLTVPLTILGMALMAWSNGCLGDWWRYKDQWVPDVPGHTEDADTEVNDVERVLLLAEDKPERGSEAINSTS